MPRIPGSLRALLAGVIDYAGLYPPACLPLAIAIERYNGFLHSPENWILNRLVLPASVLPQTRLDASWRVSLLVDEEPGPLPPQIETLETKLPARLSLPTYCEAPPGVIQGGFAKFRTGGLSPDKIPSAEEVANFLAEAAGRGLPFKATAGLHHPLRSMQPLSYDRESPRALVHGFLNLFAAAAFAWQGSKRAVLVELLEETDPGAFVFGDEDLRWRNRVLGTGDIRAARLKFAHSFGSCSFEEPVSDLQQLGLLP
jgi:hypothetical protein